MSGPELVLVLLIEASGRLQMIETQQDFLKKAAAQKLSDVYEFLALHNIEQPLPGQEYMASQFLNRDPEALGRLRDLRLSQSLFSEESLMPSEPSLPETEV
jgi:hypothetical protein